ncbi:MAG: putative peptidyl-prolyl cis-trans isomerase [Cytophagaceae bacterium]|jgi:peptidyl-prolyl cis-trans isomerase SurA|nr:putative peptidyl-prolyl cis-trans isomerase [Cytophagaceae bacterium]
MNKAFLAVIPLVLVFACQSNKPATSTTKPQGTVLGTIGSDPILSDDFSYVYTKNNVNAENAYAESSLKEYMNLYVNFRLKVKEAEALGLDTTAAFKSELEGYKKQLATPYLTEKEVTQQLIREAYDRMKEEVRASHILILLKPDADPKDTLIAYNKIKNIRDKAVKGENFDQLAKANSEDPSAATNSGDLGYFTALQMVYPFEDAAFKTPVGSISSIIRTRFGYHVLKVTGRRPSQGEVRTAHIMIRYTTGGSAEDSLAAYRKIEEISKKLSAGEPWATLVKTFSEDQQSKAKNGELPWFSTGRMVASFEDAAFALKNPGDVSKPVLTPYGWHVIKLIERKGLAPFEELEPTLKQKVTRDSRSELNKKAFLDRIKKEDEFKENTANVNATMLLADSSLTKGTLKYNPEDPKNKKTILFTIKNDAYSRLDFYEFVKGKQRPRTDVSPIVYMGQLYNQYVEETLTKWEENHLAEKYVDYRMLVKEYRDGILLFQLMDQKVWSKAVEDTAGLRAFFNENRSKYQWKERSRATILSASTKETLNKVKEEIKSEDYEVTEPVSTDLKYAKNKVAVPQESVASLDKIASALLRDKKLVLHLVETDIRNESVKSGSRKDSLIKYFVSKGIAENRIKGSVSSSFNTSNALVKLYVRSTSKKAIELRYNAKEPLALQITEGLYQKGENEWVDKSEAKTGSYSFEGKDRYYLVVIDKIEAPRPKELEECKGLVISDYQNYLEKKWLESLKVKYPVSVNEAELNKMVKASNATK